MSETEHLSYDETRHYESGSESGEMDNGVRDACLCWAHWTALAMLLIFIGLMGALWLSETVDGAKLR